MKDLINKKGIVLILLAVIGFAVYYNSLENGFHFDDTHHIINNNYVKSLTNIPRFFIDTNTFSTNRDMEHYRPLLMITHALNYAAGGLSPVGYHLVNLAFHVGSAFLIFLILNAMLEGIGHGALGMEQNDHTTFLTSLAVGLMFLVHPFNTEVINYISARSSVMSGFFYLLAFYFWVKYRGQGALSTYYYIASLLAFVVGMLSKEVVVTLPITLWLYDLYFGGCRLKPADTGAKSHITLLRWRTYLPYLPFILVVVVPYLLIRTLMFGSVLPHFARDVHTQYYTTLPVLVKYWLMFLIPIPLTLAHSVEINKTFWSFQVIHSALILLISAAIAILLSLIRSRPWRVVSFFLLWFFIVIMPVTIIPLNAIFQENRGYVAIVSFAVPAGVIVGELWKTGLRKVAIGVLVLITLVYASGVVQQNRVWRDDVTLWSDAALKAPDIPITHLSLGSAYRKAGMYEQAIKAYRNARAVGGPKYPDARYKLAQVYIEQERWALATQELEEAKEILLNAPDRRNELEVVNTDIEMVYHKSGKLKLAEKLQKEAGGRLGGGQ